MERTTGSELRNCDHYLFLLTFSRRVIRNSVAGSEATVDICFAVAAADITCIRRAVTSGTNGPGNAINFRIFFAGNKKYKCQKRDPFQIFFHK